MKDTGVIGRKAARELGLYPILQEKRRFYHGRRVKVLLYEKGTEDTSMVCGRARDASFLEIG